MDFLIGFVLVSIFSILFKVIEFTLKCILKRF
ncbi:hypothetical protein [Caudoviricetes sp.]|nr:MAG: hypothetical protein [Podoviridae sp. ct2cs2]UOF77539.1 hypothetical protein [Caudoviricetes sp.]